MAPILRKRNCSEEPENSKPAKKAKTPQTQVRSRPYFTVRNADGTHSPIPKRVTSDGETLVCPKKLNHNHFQSSDWVNAPRPQGWLANRHWPPTDITDLVAAHWTSEWCVSCDSATKCKCDVTEWRRRQKTTWKARFDLTDVPGQGVGVFSKEMVGNGVIIGELAGRIRPSDFQFGKSENHYHSQLAIGLTPTNRKVEQPKAFIDVWEYGSWTRFINHSGDPNTAFMEVRVGNTRLLSVETKKKVRAGDEVTVSYGKEYFSGEDKCLCGSKKCTNPPPEDEDEDEDDDEEDVEMAEDSSEEYLS